MSKISILGFLPAAEDTSIASSPIHWSILVSPLSEDASQPAAHLKQKPRLLRLHSVPKPPPSDTILFDMHNHQLRQQPYPVPVESSSNGEGSDEVSTTETSITSSNRDQPLQPVIRVYLARHQWVPCKLVPRLSSVLYQTPTYGPEDDWLRAALENMISSRILGSDTPTHVYSAPSILDFIHECLATNGAAVSTGTERNPDSDSSRNMIDSDYTQHLARLAQAKAMFNHSATPPRTSSITRSASSLRDAKSATADTAGKSKKRFLGFWLTHGSGGEHHHQRRCAYNPHPWQRQDDPYGGLM
ncbi:hypothetical protein PV08_09612 [Exophiala spinifera]|uniref:Uncharacterized protein n=1 Tax=Exophiala spinifera TaxID=91928 RepID=A0A0D2B0V6_9EURO|nr:uncharacterized protein PV08_09612 [Exophiala spinifera]KIW12335.1 hypothetical protein PV08_09612 [Exophiala spinifera]